MRKHIIKILTIAVITIMAPYNAFAATPIGSITVIEGTIVKNTDQGEIMLKSESDIFLNDSITSSEDGLAYIKFIDDTEITISESAQLTIDEYVYEPENLEANKAEFGITKGAFHYVSGLIAKKDDPDVNINVDFGSIGIRGTKIWRDMVPDENGELMCRIYVEDGAARVKNLKGFTTLGHGDGTKIKGINTRPTSAATWKESAIEDIKSKTALPVQNEEASE